MSPRSSAKSSASAAALGSASGAVARAPDLGDGAQISALAKLEGAIAELKALAVVPLLRRALDAIRADDARAGAEWALKALQQDERSGWGWYLLAVARERAGDFTNSLKAYQAALTLLPDQSEVANDLGRLAYRMGMKDVAEQLFRRYLTARPDCLEAINNLACAVRDQGRSADAIEILRDAIKLNPADPQLWNTLGTVVCEQGDVSAAMTFYEEAMRLDGGGTLRVLRSLIMPLSAPAIATVVILTFNTAWDEFVVALTLINSPDKRTLPIGLEAFQGAHQTLWGPLFAASMIATVPTILVYAVAQRWFQKGLNVGGLK